MIPLLLAARELGRALAAVWRDPETKALPVVAGALVLTGTLFYWRFEDWTIIEALYFCVVTLTTVGFGDLSPTTAGTQIFTIVYILTGFGVLVALLTSVAEQYLALKAEGGGRRDHAYGTVDAATNRLGTNLSRARRVECPAWGTQTGLRTRRLDCCVSHMGARSAILRPLSERPDPANRPTIRWLDRRERRGGLRPRDAAYLIVAVWLVAVVIFGIVEHFLDRETFPTVWLGMWWALQTVTTVGYGDVVPQDTTGRPSPRSSSSAASRCSRSSRRRSRVGSSHARGARPAAMPKPSSWPRSASCERGSTSSPSA